jgi:hypothetical protein
MTAPQQREPQQRPPNGSARGCPQLDSELLAGYAQGGLNPVAAWSVEAHLPSCLACRQGLAAHVDAGRLLRSKSLVLTSLALPAPGLAGRALIRCGVPEHVVRLLAVTPSLRRSWLTAVLVVLAAAVGAARLIAPGYPHGADVRGVAAVSLSSSRLAPFLVLMPLLPLAGVAASFSGRLDPARALAAAAPISGVWLLCVRVIAVVAAAVVPASLAALALPGPPWLPAVLLLPALAMCGVAVAASTVLPPLASAVAAGLAWAAIMAGLAVLARAPAAAFGQAGQLTAAVILVGAVSCLAIRRDRLDYGWVR